MVVVPVLAPATSSSATCSTVYDTSFPTCTSIFASNSFSLQTSLRCRIPTPDAEITNFLFSKYLLYNRTRNYYQSAVVSPVVEELCGREPSIWVGATQATIDHGASLSAQCLTVVGCSCMLSKRDAGTLKALPMALQCPKVRLHNSS